MKARLADWAFYAGFAFFVLAGLMTGCGGFRPRAEPRVSQDPEIKAIAEAQRDIQQSISSINRSIQQVEQNQNTQGTVIAESIEHLEKTMFGLDPGTVEVTKERNKTFTVFGISGGVVVVGVMLFFLALPAIGGPMLLYGSAAVIVLAILAPLIWMFLL